LLLAPHVDFLFDWGLISFADDGDILLSPVADVSVLQALGIPRQLPNTKAFTKRQATYLDYHRAHVFLKASPGPEESKKSNAAIS